MTKQKFIKVLLVAAFTMSTSGKVFGQTSSDLKKIQPNEWAQMESYFQQNLTPKQQEQMLAPIRWQKQNEWGKTTNDEIKRIAVLKYYMEAHEIAQACSDYKKIVNHTSSFSHPNALIAAYAGLAAAGGFGAAQVSDIALKQQISTTLDTVASQFSKGLEMDLSKGIGDVVGKVGITDPSRFMEEIVRNGGGVKAVEARFQMPLRKFLEEEVSKDLDNVATIWINSRTRMLLTARMERAGLGQEVSDALLEPLKSIKPEEMKPILDSALKKAGLTSATTLHEVFYGSQQGKMEKVAEALGEELSKYSVEKAVIESPKLESEMAVIARALLKNSSANRAGTYLGKNFPKVAKSISWVGDAIDSALLKAPPSVLKGIGVAGRILGVASVAMDAYFIYDGALGTISTAQDKYNDVARNPVKAFSADWNAEKFCKSAGLSHDVRKEVIGMAAAMDKTLQAASNSDSQYVAHQGNLTSMPMKQAESSSGSSLVPAAAFATH